MTKRNHPPLQGSSASPDSLYRPGVGMAIFNRDGEVLIAERLDNPGGWQMPQGGIDEGEDPEVAVFREMEEEIGTRNAKILGVMDEWVRYDLPASLAGKLWDGKYRGQRQKWIALEFLGQDSDIRLDSHTHPEFSRWKWIPLKSLADYAVPFKRDIYERVAREFSLYAAVRD
jgi:putative (di)nucleoside polyphosphate hydrolase